LTAIAIVLVFVSILFLILSPETIKNLFFQPFFDALSSSNALEDVLALISVYLLGIIAVYFVFFVIGILFSIGLITLRKDVGLSLASGILNIIGLVLLVIGIGAILMLVALILEIIILFKESRK
jgi:uncharacterized membrane protein